MSVDPAFIARLLADALNKAFIVDEDGDHANLDVHPAGNTVSGTLSYPDLGRRYDFHLIIRGGPLDLNL